MLLASTKFSRTSPSLTYLYESRSHSLSFPPSFVSIEEEKYMDRGIWSPFWGFMLQSEFHFTMKQHAGDTGVCGPTIHRSFPSEVSGRLIRLLFLHLLIPSFCPGLRVLLVPLDCR